MRRYRHQPLTIEKYNPEWADLYAKEKENLKAALNNRLLDIEHIGSTSVPGMTAKPIIDILITVTSQKEAIKCIALLAGLDYEFMDKTDHWYLRKYTGKNKGFHLHMTTPDSKYRKIALSLHRYLLIHPEVCSRYSKLKEDIVDKTDCDRNAYRNAKTKFVKELIDSALQESKIM